MGHMVDGRFCLVTCGSKSHTPTQQRYSTIELECLAVHFAIAKCSFYLKGCESFTVATDHRPLEGIFKKDIFEIPNQRLQRILEKLAEFNMIVKWVPGKSHHFFFQGTGILLMHCHLPHSFPAQKRKKSCQLTRPERASCKWLRRIPNCVLSWTAWTQNTPSFVVILWKKHVLAPILIK